MKKLLNKTLRTFVVYSLVVLAASVPAYYYLVDSIWLGELDENNEIIAARIENELNRSNLNDADLAESITLWNKIQPGTNLKDLPENYQIPDSTYTALRQYPYSEHTDIDRFRGLSKTIKINGKPYRLIVETNVEETEEIIGAIAMITFLFFLILIIGFLILNKRLSVQLWKPFRSTLAKLKAFNLNSQKEIKFEKSDTVEFEELNDALSKLIAQNIFVYKTQKEFTENASHELQTPLAILKNKVDILLQSKDLTEKQYYIAEDMNKALTRSSRINKNLLLLAKIDNSQFDTSGIIRFDAVLQQSMEVLKEHFEQKNIVVTIHALPDVQVNGNSSLTEVLINNLLLNAIRHTLPGGSIAIKLTTSVFQVSNSGNKELNEALLYKRFSRLSGDNSGSGLGLAIVKEICKIQKWTIHYRFDNSHHIFSVHV